MKLHPLSTALLIVAGGALAYTVIFSLSGVLLQPDQSFRGQMMAMMGNFASPVNTIINAVALLAALGTMFALSLLFFRRGADQPNVPKDDFSVLKRALSEDERLLLEEVRKVSGGITQDSLRFRLDWSKAKVSALLVNLDRMGLVQRERMGKTYKVHYQERAADEKQP